MTFLMNQVHMLVHYQCAVDFCERPSAAQISAVCSVPSRRWVWEKLDQRERGGIWGFGSREMGCVKLGDRGAVSDDTGVHRTPWASIGGGVRILACHHRP